VDAKLLRVAIALALALVAAVPSAALAVKPTYACPSEDSSFFVVTLAQWWEISVDGFEAEGIPVYEADGVTFTGAFDELAAGAGFGDGQGLHDFIWGPQWDAIDKNGNGYGCMKRRPHTPGNPSYFFTGVDDAASTGNGQSA
jgi:hypothetical protein